MMITYEEALSRHAVTIPAHLVAQAEVPVLPGPQVQGDVIVTPTRPGLMSGETVEVPAGGVQVVRGEATSNTHWLDNGNVDAAPCEWTARTATASDPMLGVLVVPEGQFALLTHTDEHGSNGIAPGCYRVGRQVEHADQIRLVQD